MKKTYLSLLVLLCAVLFCSCGAKTTDATNPDFQYKDGVYTQIGKDYAVYVIMKDFTGMSDQELGDFARSVGQESYDKGLRCVSIVTKPEADNKIDFNKLQPEEWTARAFIYMDDGNEILSGHNIFSLENQTLNDYITLFVNDELTEK